ncbi:MAG TPA: response regulator transcription factor [Actinomycetota bacterium]|nr:response regulator transcription factor [Actinomycetota bacterium]
MSIRVVVVEDHTLVREGLVTMLDVEEDIEVVAQAGDGEEALEVILEHEPDVVMLDLRLPGMDGMEVLKRVKAQKPQIRVLVLTVHDEQQYVGEAVLSGADGYLLKTVSHAELTDAARRIAKGEAVLHPAVARSVLTELTTLAAGGPDDGGLSPREREILTLLAQGLSNKQIASRLQVGVETVKTHISSILGKLDAVDRTQAVALALRRGLIE